MSTHGWQALSYPWIPLLIGSGHGKQPGVGRIDLIHPCTPGQRVGAAYWLEGGGIWSTGRWLPRKRMRSTCCPVAKKLDFNFNHSVSGGANGNVVMHGWSGIDNSYKSIVSGVWGSFLSWWVVVGGVG